MYFLSIVSEKSIQEPCPSNLRLHPPSVQLETGPELPPGWRASVDGRMVAVARLKRTARTGRGLPARLVTETMLMRTVQSGKELPVGLVEEEDFEDREEPAGDILGNWQQHPAAGRSWGLHNIQTQVGVIKLHCQTENELSIIPRN